jgi:uncharacterized protein DUF3105
VPGAGPGRKITIDTSSPRRALVVALAGLAVLAGCSTARTGGEASGESAPAVDTRAFQPSKTNKDPSKDIKGVVMTQYKPGHARPGQRVAYDKLPPYGGQHDPYWADCSGTVYATAVRNENMVHALEHGAVWVAYDPARVRGAAVQALAAKVDGQPYLMLSPYPKMGVAVSIQSWGHQLKVGKPDDPRIDQFIVALRNNPYTTPESGAPCGTNPDSFDITNPPPLDPSPPGPDAAPVQGP